MSPGRGSRTPPSVPSAGNSIPPEVGYFNVFPKRFPKLNLMEDEIMEICFQVNFLSI